MHPRIARRRLAVTEDSVRILGLLGRTRVHLGEDTQDLDRMIVRAQSTCAHLEELAGEPVVPRHTVKVKHRTEDSAPRRRFYVYIDECGNHAPIDLAGEFPVFCLTAVIIDAEDLERANRLFLTWKAMELGSPRSVFHEPELRLGRKLFAAKNRPARELAAKSLAETIQSIPLTCIAAVLNKREFESRYPTGSVDDFLPKSTYLICVDMLFERVQHFLYTVGQDAVGIVIAESRGEREDAEVQAEFLRLQLFGTQYVKHSAFRNQFRSYILFKKKASNETGLQLADALARPIAEKSVGHRLGILPHSIVDGKIYDGGQGRPESYGVKIFPTPIEHPWSIEL